MIRELHLENFKCFEDQSLRFRPLTLLSGLNGMGKSSVLQALLLLRQSYEQGLLQQTGLALNGDLINIGTATDALYEGAREDVIGFELVLDDESVAKWSFDYDREADVLKLKSTSLADARTLYTTSLFDIHFHYLQAERVGPRRFFETSDFLVRQRRQLSADGRFTAHFLSIFGREDISNVHLSHPNAKSLNLLDQVEAWIGEVSPGTRIQLTPNIDLGVINLQYAFPMGQLYSKNYRSTNVGFGITYTLPILVAVLSATPGTLILIENPEAHLHPKGQARIGELLALAASSGIQVIFETHSDHVLNGMRVAVHDGKLAPDDVQLHYFQRRAEDGHSMVVSPRIDRDGRIDQWPDGFFDEWDKSLEALL